MGKSPSPLPAFSFNWVGGDIHGLSNLAGHLYSFAASTEGPVSSLTNVTNRLVADSNATSWKGPAADSFKAAISQDMTDINWLSGHATTIGDIVDALAVQLAKIESTLEGQFESFAKGAGITIDSSGRFQIPGNCDPAMRNKFLMMTKALPAKAQELARVARKSAASKLVSEYKAISNGLANYRDNHPALLSTQQLNDLKSKISGLSSDFNTADKPLQHRQLSAHDKSVMKDLVAGAVTVDTGIVGGVVGAIVGTAVEPGGGTAAGAVGGAGLGLAIGAPLGQWVGSLFD